jgi:hypothetical protein
MERRLKRVNKLLVGKQYQEGLQYAVFDGIAYTPYGWHGCQLQSVETSVPKLGTRRPLTTRDYHYEVEIFSVSRIGFRRFECNWCLPQRCGYDEYAKQFSKMLSDIFRWR